MIDFKDIEYLKRGTCNQKAAYRCLKNLKIFEILKHYNPILTGTIPINLYTPKSDLDIICNVLNFNSFHKLVRANYGHFPNFLTVNENNSMTIEFQLRKFKIELYAENKSVLFQNAYIHMITEYRLLKMSCRKFRRDLIRLKKCGLKTEPAFGKLLSLPSPYEQLYNLYFVDDSVLLRYLTHYAK